MKLDPATMREAARQLREEGKLVCGDPGCQLDSCPARRSLLESMARRFENEARAAERAKEETNAD